MYVVHALVLFIHYCVTILATFEAMYSYNSEEPNNRQYRTTYSPS